MLIDILGHNKTDEYPTISELYYNIKNNINQILKNDEIRAMLDPKSNSTTRKLLETNIDEEAYTLSYLITIIIMFKVYGIDLKE